MSPRETLTALIEENAGLFNWVITYGLDSALDAFTHVLPIPVARGVVERALYRYTLKQVGEATGIAAPTVDDFYRVLPGLLSHATDEQIEQVQTMLLASVRDTLLIRELTERGLLTPVDKADTIETSVQSP